MGPPSLPPTPTHRAGVRPCRSPHCSALSIVPALRLVLAILVATPVPAGAADAVRASAAAASAIGPPAGPAAIPATRAELAALEAFHHEGRARPEATAAKVQAWMAGLPPSAVSRTAALELLGLWAAEINDAQASERAALQLEQLARQVPSLRARGMAAQGYVRARWAYSHGSVGRAERLLAEGLARLPADTAPLQHLRHLVLAGDIRERAGRFDEAVRWYLQALALADAHAPDWLRSDVRSSFAYVLHQAGQKDRAEPLTREALQLAAEAGDEMALSRARTTEAVLLSGQQQDERELRALGAAIEHARRAGARRQETLALANIADYYLQRGEYATSLAMSQRALPLARELRMPTSESLALTNMGLAMIGLQRKEEGLRHLQASLAIEERTGTPANVAITYREMGQYLERAGELGDAYEAYRHYRKLADEVFRQEQQEAILELQERYDNERRARDLELLNRQNRLKDEQLRQRELQQRVWASAAALGVLSVSVVALLLQRVRRANRQLASANEQLKVLSERDPLTGLANRRHLQQVMKRQRRGSGIEGTVYLLDIDHFKQINDHRGHAVGDAVLVEIARRLRATLREEDLIVRWGGEEFLVVVQQLAPDRVEALAERLLQAVAETAVPAEDGPVPVSVSIGFATFPLEPAGVALGWEQAIGLVDTALYLAKTHGRNRAYGIRLMQADSAEQALAMGRRLEQHWQAGQVALTLLQGPPPPTREKAA